MSDANIAISTKQVIISLVIFGVMVATADQIGRNILLAKFTARLDSFESNIIARLDSLENSIIARLDSLESIASMPADDLEKNFEARDARVNKGGAPSPDLELR